MTDGPGISPLNDKFIASICSSFPTSGDPKWFALWKLRDQCARAICPELRYIKYLGNDPGEAQRKFEALQKDAFEKFLTFMEEELAAVDEPTDVAETIGTASLKVSNFLKKDEESVSNEAASEKTE